MKASKQTTTTQEPETPVEVTLVTLTTEVPQYVRNAVENERIAQKRPSRSNMVSVILQEWVANKEKAQST